MDAKVETGTIDSPSNFQRLTKIHIWNIMALHEDGGI